MAVEWIDRPDGTFVARCLPTPPGVNPYEGPGLAGTPRWLERLCSDTSQLAGVVREAEFLRKTDSAAVAAKAGVPREAVERLERDGTGMLRDVRAVLDALGVRPVTLPPLSQLRGAF